MNINTFFASVGGLAIVFIYALLRYWPMVVAAIVVTHFVIKWW